MASEFRILLDLNVLLDVLQRREPFFETSARVLAAAETGAVDAWIAAHSVTTLFYLYARQRSAEHARVLLTDLLSFLTVATVDHSVIEQALNLPYEDFEDAVQMMAAAKSGAQYLVTRNVRGFAHGPLPALHPAEVLALL